MEQNVKGATADEVDRLIQSYLNKAQSHLRSSVHSRCDSSIVESTATDASVSKCIGKTFD